MSETDQSQSRGFSKSERAQMIRTAIFGLLAFMITLWLVYTPDVDVLPLPGYKIALTGLFSYLSSMLISVTQESLIEDVIKLVMFSVLWWFTSDYQTMNLISLGMLIGGATGFLNNRLPSHFGLNR